MKIRSEQGVSAVEFALVLPFLLFITFGIIEFGILLFDKAVITNASREGARHGIVFATDDEGVYAPRAITDINNVVKQYANPVLLNLGPAGKDAIEDVDIIVKAFDGDDPTTEISLNDRKSGDYLRVIVNFTYDFLIMPDLSNLLNLNFRGQLPLQGETIMRME